MNPFKESGWKCECGCVFKTRKEYYHHRREDHGITNRCNQYNRAEKLGLSKPIVSEETRKKIGEKSKGRKMSDETRARISESMKRAHIEGRAWNIGKSRWKNKPSYPEKWFMRVIENEFDDKNYEREKPCGIYSIDFVWIHKMRCIEIDGNQHQRFQDVIERDKRKNEKLALEGWKVLRMKWDEVYADTQQWIKIAKAFIDEGEEVPFEKRYKTRKEKLEKTKLMPKIKKVRVNIHNSDEYVEVELKRKQPLCTLTDIELDLRKKMILDTGIDITKYGWVKEVTKATGLSKRQIEKVFDRLPGAFRRTFRSIL
jgi:very-short-patch-repair endonuclease